MPADLILLHGFTQTGRSWRRRRTRSRHATGRSRRTCPATAQFAAPPGRVRRLRRPTSARSAGERFTLAGYSMGGRIALHAALALRERVERLVLVGASPGLADPAERARAARPTTALADRIEAIGVEAFVREWGAQPLFAGKPRAASPTPPTPTGCATPPPALAAALRGLGTGVMPPLWDRLRASWRSRSTLVVGERDEKFRAIAERDGGAAAERAAHVVVPGAGHAVHLEAPRGAGRATVGVALSSASA